MSEESAGLESSEQFVRLLTAIQGPLYGYIFSLLADRDAARDVLQETNVVLWRKSGDYQPDTNFTAWAYSIARNKVLAHRRDLARDRHLFGDGLLAQLAGSAEADCQSSTLRTQALEECVDALPERQRQLIRHRYSGAVTVQQLAAARNQSAAAVSVTLNRIRKALLACVEGKLLERGAT